MTEALSIRAALAAMEGGSFKSLAVRSTNRESWMMSAPVFHGILPFRAEKMTRIYGAVEAGGTKFVAAIFRLPRPDWRPRSVLASGHPA
jgi:hypothetical protein